VVAVLRRFGFQFHNQEGSHMKLRRISPEGRRETLSVPRHRQLVTKTLFNIYKQACKFIPEEELRPYFYTD
jgi:predicted RNA binding protein YcfA (HicA-like mRNA interferase family)